MKKTPVLLVMVTVALSACASAAALPTKAEQADTAPTPSSSGPSLSLDVLKNSTYRSPDWGEFQLTDGVFFRPPQAPGESAEIYQTRLGDTYAFGDLNADGAEDAIVFLYTQNGGTGHFVDMAAMLNRNGSAENISTLTLGDRENITSVQIANGVVILDLIVHGPDDPMCCPSQQEQRQYKVENNLLIRLN